MKKIGIFSGTFDPVHHGHLAFASLAAEAIGLDKVIFLPEKFPRNKKSVTNLNLRKEMLEIALENSNKFQVFDTGEDNFSLSSTMPILREKFGEADYIILLGTDSAEHLSEWQGIESLPMDVSFLIALREHPSPEKVIDSLSQTKFASRMSFIESPEPGAKSSLIRSLSMGTKITALDKFIKKAKIYQRN